MDMDCFENYIKVFQFIFQVVRGGSEDFRIIDMLWEDNFEGSLSSWIGGGERLKVRRMVLRFLQLFILEEMRVQIRVGVEDVEKIKRKRQ